MAPKMICIIGGLDYDLTIFANRIPNAGESLLANEHVEALGGKGANSAIATYRTCHRKPHAPHETPTIGQTFNEFEVNVRMVGAVGDDRYGERFYAEMNKNGVDTSGIVTVPNTQSSICFVIVEENTRENRCLFTLGATAVWRKEHFLCVEDLGRGIRPDLCVAQMEIHKEGLTHLLVNESEAAIMSERNLCQVNKDTWPIIGQEFLDRGVKNVVITLGAKGAYYATATECGHCLAYDVKVVDTTGAG
ncbi:Ribokinase-like protein [Setomelanomma holmii]|uniref:Ribokinase-like protein n=1 Tax=Setomelanomma holmii TaxID=210430 RepID=A0A9P4LFL7_9PLEO|nr:Ribokinase-like protein [Setomelanomma holmii]